MDEENISIEMDREIPLIRELNMQIDHDDVDAVSKEFDAIMDLDVLQSVTGTKYVKRLAQILRREKHEECMLCGKTRMQEAVLCEDCLAKYKNTPLTSDQRVTVREIMNKVKPKEEDISHGSQYIGQFGVPNRASKFVLFFAVLVLVLIGYIVCKKVIFQPQHKANFATASYTPDEVIAEYEILLEANAQRFLGDEIDVEFVKKDVNTDQTGVTGYQVLINGENEGLYVITFIDEFETVKAVTVYSCEDDTYERCFGGILLQLTKPGKSTDEVKSLIDSNIGNESCDWCDNYIFVYKEDSFILSGKGFYGNMGEAINSLVGHEF